MSRHIKHFYQFGPFLIDTVNRRLLREGEVVPLKAKVVETLLLLVRHNGEVIEKDELMKQLWPNSFVEEANLTQNIYMLRKALGERNYIETVPRRGYRFAAQVKEWDDTPADLILVKETTKTSISYEEETDDGFDRLPARSGGDSQQLQLAAGDAVRHLPLQVSADIKYHSAKKGWFFGALATGLAAIAIGIVVFWPKTLRTPFANVKLTRFTTTGNVIKAAISPDGKYLAHVIDDNGLKSLWLRQVATGKDLQLVPPAHVEWFYGLTFSHDGNYIYYVNQEMNQLGMLYQVPSLGGTPTKLIEDVDSAVTLSPDDRQLAFIRNSPGVISITIANVNGSGERKLFSSARTDSFKLAPIWTIPPAWSPDGKIIACQVAITTPEGQYETIWAIRTADGSTTPLTSQRWETLGRIEWMADGVGLLTTGAERGSDSGQQIWLISYPQGSARRITNDLSDYRDLSLTADGKSLIAVQSERKANIWVASATDMNRVTQITFTNYDGLDGLSWTPDGKVVYTVFAGGEENLWLADMNGGTPKQLTSHAGLNQQPVVSPDGRYVVFVSNRSGYQHLWRIDVDGRHPEELSHGSADLYPSFTSDSQWIIFRSVVSGKSNLFRVAINGGEMQTFGDAPGHESLLGKVGNDATVSPNGKQVALVYVTGFPKPIKMAIMSNGGGELRVLRDLPAHYGRFRWTSDSERLTYADKEARKGNIWIQPLNSDPPSQLTHWANNPIFFFDWSRDGKLLAYANGTMTSDVVLISDVR